MASATAAETSGLLLAEIRGLEEEIRGLEEKWHYEGGSRDLRLDLLRGFAVFAMIADHIGGDHSWLYVITGGNRFMVSAAEAFVFISGVVMGMVYLKAFTTRGIGSALIKALHRAWSLYVLTVVLTLGFAALGYAFGLWWTPDISGVGVGGYALNVFTLHTTLYLTDIPLMYTLLLLLAGPVILLLSEGYTSLVLVLTWLVWGLWQVAPHSAIDPWQIQGNSVFNLPAWQVLFVTGIVLGWHRSRIEALVRRISHPVLFWSLALVSLTIGALYVIQLTDLGALERNSTLYALAFDKADLPVGRLLVFGLLATFAFTLVTLFWEPLWKATGWLLLPLGQNALTAYTLHVLLVVLTTKLTLTIFAGWSGSAFFETCLQAVGVLAVWLIVWTEPKLKDALRERMLARVSEAIAVKEVAQL